MILNLTVKCKCKLLICNLCQLSPTVCETLVSPVGFAVKKGPSKFPQPAYWVPVSLKTNLTVSLFLIVLSTVHAEIVDRTGENG